jgi:hypothetical protein
MPPSNEYLIMKMNACFQTAAVGLNMLERAALRRYPSEKTGAINLTGFGEVATNVVGQLDVGAVGRSARAVRPSAPQGP